MLLLLVFVMLMPLSLFTMGTDDGIVCFLDS